MRRGEQSWNDKSYIGQDALARHSPESKKALHQSHSPEQNKQKIDPFITPTEKIEGEKPKLLGTLRWYMTFSLAMLDIEDNGIISPK